MGAVVNQAPELYCGVGCHVPFLDVLTTMLDESIPLTTNEYDEWGNPNDPIFTRLLKRIHRTIILARNTTLIYW